MNIIYPTQADFAAIASKGLEATNHFPYLYSPFVHPTMGLRYKCAGIATAVGTDPKYAGSVAIVEMKAPGSLVLPNYCGDQLTREEGADRGAVLAIDCAAGIIVERSLAGLATADEEALFKRAEAQAADDHEVVNQSIEPGQRYLVCDNWGHLFGPGRAETMTRWVVDLRSDGSTMPFAQFEERDQWKNLLRQDVADLFESVRDNDVAANFADFDARRSETLPLWALYVLWDRLADVPISRRDELQKPFEHFGKGAAREAVWQWFEAQSPMFVVGEVMQGIRRASRPSGERLDARAVTDHPRG